MIALQFVGRIDVVDVNHKVYDPTFAMHRLGGRLAVVA
jgi:hypothetical protein